MTVTCIVAGADLPAPSTADTVTVAVPPWYFAAVTVSEQVSVAVPQLEGETAIPGLPAVATDAGTKVLLVLATEKRRAPVPLTVNGSAVDVVVELASIETSGKAVIVGTGRVPSVPMASMRP